MDAFTVLNPAEVTRTYVWPNGVRDTITGVSKILVRPSGTHRLETLDGKKHIVPSGWIRVELDVASWTL